MHTSLSGSGAAALVFALLAWVLRSSGSYPICHNDEGNWISIAHQLDAGVRWPVSGPAFIHTVRTLSEKLQFSHAHSISVVGVGGVFVSDSADIGYAPTNDCTYDVANDTDEFIFSYDLDGDGSISSDEEDTIADGIANDLLSISSMSFTAPEAPENF